MMIAKLPAPCQWNVSALGPRQAKQLVEGLRRLLREASTYSERSSDGTMFTLYEPFGRTTRNPLALNEYQALGERFAWTATKDNLPAVRSSLTDAINRTIAARPILQNA